MSIFPRLDYPLFNVITHYPAGSPEDIEILVTDPIERELFKLPHIRRVSSVSAQGFSQVTVEFDWNVDSAYAYQLVLQALAAIRHMLPENVKPVVENLGSSLQEILGFGIVPLSKDISLSDLKYFVKSQLANQIRSLNGVQRVEVIGGHDGCILVSPNIGAMMKYHLTPLQLAKIIKENNYQVIVGYLQNGNKDFAVRGKGNIESISELKNITVKVIKGHPILLKDIAKIKMDHLPQRYQVFINGKPGIALSVFKTVNSDAVKVAKRVKKLLEELIRKSPYPVSVVKYYDQSELIDNAMKNMDDTILISGILVILVLLIFLGRIKDALIIGLTIPVIGITSFLFFHIENLTLNMITIGAMAVAIGMVVDDSIIVLENILRHMEMGEATLAAVVKGVKEIFYADLSGTLTTIAAFIPFIFLGGLPGKFTKAFGSVVVTTLAISLVISLTFIPTIMTRDSGKGAGKESYGHGFIVFFKKLNRSILGFFLKHKFVAIVGALALFIVSSALLTLLPASFLPPVDEGAILLEYVLPPGTSLAESERIGHIIEEIALSDPDVTAVYRRTGSESGTYQVEPVNRGEIVIKLKPQNIRKRSIGKVIEDLKKATSKIPGVIMLIHQVTAEKIDESMSGLPGIFGLTIYGNDYKKLVEFSRKIENVIKTVPGVESEMNLSKYEVPVYSIKPRRDMLGKYGLTTRGVMDNLKYYLTGGVVTNLLSAGRRIPVYLFPDENFSDIRDLLKLPIKVGDGFVPLQQVVSFRENKTSGKITHINLQREVTISMDISAPPNRVMRKIKERISTLNASSNFFMKFTGQYSLFIEMVKKGALLLFVSVLLIYVILGMQFGNYLQPLAIMLEVPFAFTGAFFAIEITGQTLNLSFFIGLILLLGISVNNGIVLIDFINKLKAEGYTIDEAIETATAMRTRPILLTAITSIAGLIPISLGIGIGSRIHQSLAIAVIGGLVVSTFLTLNLLPAVYHLFEKQ